jgi:hypothetical protein
LDSTDYLLAANLVPRNWISVGMLGLAITEEADITVDWRARPSKIHSGKLASTTMATSAGNPKTKAGVMTKQIMI